MGDLTPAEIAMLQQEAAALTEQQARSEAKTDPLPCGHPAACATDGACRWCADLQSRARLIGTLATIARIHGIEEPSHKAVLDAVQECKDERFRWVQRATSAEVDAQALRERLTRAEAVVEAARSIPYAHPPVMDAIGALDQLDTPDEEGGR